MVLGARRRRRRVTQGGHRGFTRSEKADLIQYNIFASQAFNVKAKYKDGVLKLNLAKAKEQSVKKVEVKTS
jgi:HSP20 family molecular chaperone IbpA